VATHDAATAVYAAAATALRRKGLLDGGEGGHVGGAATPGQSGYLLTVTRLGCPGQAAAGNADRRQYEEAGGPEGAGELSLYLHVGLATRLVLFI